MHKKVGLDTDKWRFDVQTYLEDKNIKIKKHGKDIGSGWIGIACPFPGCPDSMTHCGIHLKEHSFKCWICGEKGRTLRLVQVIEDCDWQTAFDISRKYPIDDLDPWEELHRPVIASNNRSQLCLPDEIENTWPAMHLDYLRRRNFDPHKIIDKYHLMPVYNIGQYRFRIIAPIFLNHKMVSFVAADILRKDQRLPYVNCSKEKSIIPVNHCFYNLDSVKNNTAILVEGITDVWRLGDGAIASFTSTCTDEQILLLIKKKIQHLFILYDPDAIHKAQKLGDQLSAVIRHVEMIKLHSGDPADMTEQEVKAMRKDLLNE